MSMATQIQAVEDGYKSELPVIEWEPTTVLEKLAKVTYDVLDDAEGCVETWIEDFLQPWIEDEIEERMKAYLNEEVN